MMEGKIHELRDVNEAFRVYTGRQQAVYVINEDKKLSLLSDMTLGEYKWLMEHPNNNFIFFVLGDASGERMRPFSHCFD